MMRTTLFLSLAATAWVLMPNAVANDLAAKVEAAGGLIEFNEAGEPIAIDLYNGNNPLKGKGGRNELVTDEWLANLAGLTSLKRLSVSNCAVEGPGLEHVGELTSLEELNLTLTPVSDDGLAHLGKLTQLRVLGLASTKCTGSGFKHLKALKNLESVNFHFTPLNDEGLAAICEVGVSGRLWFAHTKFTDKGAGPLAKLTDMRICGIGGKGPESTGEAVAYLTKLPKLEDLSLLDDQASPEGIAHAATIKTLRRLDVAYAPTADDASLKLIAKMPALEELRFGGSQKVTDEGIQVLAESKSLKKVMLQRLKSITEEGVAKLRKARPDWEFEFK